MSHILVIGDFRFDEESDDEIKFTVEISSARKIDAKEGDGDDDATTTRKGRKAREVTIKLSWPDREDANKRAQAWLEKLDASISKPGDPPSFGYERNGLDIAAIKAVRAIEIEDCKGPNRNDNGVNEYEIKAKSWVKPAPKAAKAGDTPTDPKKFTMVTNRVFGTDKLTAKGPAASKPSVKP